ncbi:MAG: DUF883 family protein [Sphingobium sp.]|nr:DUF883 family protein [Sphingobium sp.]
MSKTDPKPDASSPTAAVRKGIKQVRRRGAEVIADAREIGEAVIADARDKSEAVIAGAREKGEAAITTARKKSEAAIATAREKSEAAIATAREKSEAVIEDTREKTMRAAAETNRLFQEHPITAVAAAAAAGAVLGIFLPRFNITSRASKAVGQAVKAAVTTEAAQQLWSSVSKGGKGAPDEDDASGG